MDDHYWDRVRSDVLLSHKLVHIFDRVYSEVKLREYTDYPLKDEGLNRYHRGENPVPLLVQSSIVSQGHTI